MTGFGKVLRDLRERTRLSQSKLAEYAGYDHSFVSRLESEHRQPTRESIRRFYETLRVANGTINTADYQRLMEAAGFLVPDADELPPSETEIKSLLLLLEGELRNDLGSNRDKRTLIYSIRLMLDGCTYKDIA